ncbi:hypothetical protein ACFL7M_16405 [Thermodesulfobacteriota bacterium]
MKSIHRLLTWLIIALIVSISSSGDISAETLFKGRKIFLSNDKNHIFRIGVTGTTAGHNYIALIENVKQESISLSDLGYWELVADPPSYLRNYDLQLTVMNNHKGHFQIEFKYMKGSQNIDYQIKEGAIQIKFDNNGYYPTLIIRSIASVTKSREEGIIRSDSNRIIFFDFNSLDIDLRKHYGGIKRLLRGSDSSHYFYLYESGDYNSYYFKTYQDVARLNTDKMGLSLEDGTLEYYQKVLDNLKSHFGARFATQVTIVSRFGNRFSKELKEYAYEIGLSREMTVTFWSYNDIR